MRVAVVGAGAAGLVAVKTLLDEGFSVVCYEKHSTLGGIWVFDEREVDDNGIPVTSRMYRGLKTNLPKEIMGFPGYPFPDQDDSYVGHEDVLQYLNSYAKEFDLTGSIKFEHMVKSISPAESSKRWNFVVRDVRHGVDFEEVFDAVFLCTGHYMEPNIPDIPGFKDFEGVKMHFYQFRSSAQLKDVRRLAVVGSGPSSWELCAELSEQFEQIYWFAKEKSISGLAKLGPNVKRFVSIPLKRCTRTGVQLESGEEIRVDAIVLCTGYLYSFPFLAPECGIRVENARVSPLYKHCVNIEHPTMFFISLFSSYFPNVTSHYQVKFCANVLRPKNGFRLPDTAAMLEDADREMEKRTAKGWPPHYYHRLGPFMFEYCDELAAMTGETKGYPTVFRKLGLYAAQWRGTDLHAFRRRKFRILNDDEFEDVTGDGLEPVAEIDGSINFRL